MRKIIEVRHLKIISLGLGQQSTALYLMSSTGAVERADFAIFSDTGSESKATYDYLRWLKSWAKQHQGIPILHTGKRTLYRDLANSIENEGNRFASIPAFTKDDTGRIGILRRQCTHEYKIVEIFKSIRKLYSLGPRRRTPATEVWLGITQDEMERAKYPPYRWLTYVYPFLNLRSTKSSYEKISSIPVFRRSECTAWLQTQGYPIPPKSACTFCPFQPDSRWRELKMNQPKEWKRVVRLDERIRNSSRKGVNNPMYLHRSAKPLKEVELKENQQDLFKAECDGVCGI